MDNGIRDVILLRVPTFLCFLLACCHHKTVPVIGTQNEGTLSIHDNQDLHFIKNGK